MIIKTNRKCILHSICLILVSILLLLSNIASAVVEINTTYEDNLVILLDYSGTTIPFRPYIQSNALYSIQNIEDKSNVSVVVYGGFINNSNVYPMDTQKNRTILEDFVRNITGNEGDAARDNISDGFIEARKILYNSTGTKQIVLISDGNVDGKTNGKIDNALLIELVKDLKKNNVTINLYQVIDTDISQTLKATWVREPYRDLSDKINTEVVVLNQSERIRFFKPKPINSTYKPSVSISNQTQFADEYMNEFSNNGETSSIIFSMNYDSNKIALSRDLSTASTVNFYSYCDKNQTCTIIPFDIQQRRFFDNQTLEDVFRGKNAIELVKSGNITESAYTLPNSVGELCAFFDFFDINEDTFNEQSINFIGEELPSIERKTLPFIDQKSIKTTTKAIKIAKWSGLISEVDYPLLIVSGAVSGECKLSKEDKLLRKIIYGGEYPYVLGNGYAYYGITREFQIYNKGIIDDIEYRKQAYFGILNNLIYVFNSGDISYAEPMVKNNNIKLTQLLNQDYKEDAESAFSRINYKSEESQVFINNATSELNDLNSQIPYTFTEAVLNFIEEPETDYSMARLKQSSADDYLNKARENQAVYKFNIANQNSNYSIAQSREGMVFANMENSKQRYPKKLVWLFGGIIVIFLTVIIIKKLSNPP